MIPNQKNLLYATVFETYKKARMHLKKIEPANAVMWYPVTNKRK